MIDKLLQIITETKKEIYHHYHAENRNFVWAVDGQN